MGELLFLNIHLILHFLLISQVSLASEFLGGEKPLYYVVYRFIIIYYKVTL